MPHKNKPIYKRYIRIEKGIGIKIYVWKNSIEIINLERLEGKWKNKGKVLIPRSKVAVISGILRRFSLFPKNTIFIHFPFNSAQTQKGKYAYDTEKRRS